MSLTNTKRKIHKYKIFVGSGSGGGGALHRVNTNKKLSYSKPLLFMSVTFLKLPMNGKTMMFKLRPCGKI
jgi:hypothetical protein